MHNNMHNCDRRLRKLPVFYLNEPTEDIPEDLDEATVKNPAEYSGRFYTPIPEIGNHRSDMKETAIPF